MVDSPTPHARMARDSGAYLRPRPLDVVKRRLRVCVLDLLALARPRTHAAGESTIWRLRRRLGLRRRVAGAKVVLRLRHRRVRLRVRERAEVGAAGCLED